MSAEAAAQALSNAVQADDGRDSPGVPGPGAQDAPDAPELTSFDINATQGNQANEQPATPPVESQETSSDEEGLLSKDIDLSTLAPEARDWLTAREREMQAVMTRKTQEAAELQKQYEGLDPQVAREALGFYEGIRRDPNYAAEVYDLLTQNLIAAGYEPARAAYEASQRTGVQEESQEPPAYDEDPEAAIKYRLDEIDRRQAQMDEQARIAEMQRLEDQLASQILAQENSIRQARPDLKQSDIDRIYDLSPDGNLFEGFNKYQAWQNDVIQEYLSRKAAVPDAATPPAATPPGRPPLDFHDKDGNPSVEMAHAAALEVLRQKLAQDG